MIVVIAGIKRSGSTAQYNMVRLILEKHFDKVHGTGIPTDIQEPCTIVKIHTFDKALFDKADFVFTTDRAKSEILRSLKAFNRGDVKIWGRMQKDLRRWRKRSCELHYNSIVNKPFYCIEKLADHLGMDVNVAEIYRDFQAIKPPKDKEYDPKTMLFNNHITSK